MVMMMMMIVMILLMMMIVMIMNNKLAEIQLNAIIHNRLVKNYGHKRLV